MWLDVIPCDAMVVTDWVDCCHHRLGSLRCHGGRMAPQWLSWTVTKESADETLSSAFIRFQVVNRSLDGFLCFLLWSSITIPKSDVLILLLDLLGLGTRQSIRIDGDRYLIMSVRISRNPPVDWANVVCVGCVCLSQSIVDGYRFVTLWGFLALIRPFWLWFSFGWSRWGFSVLVCTVWNILYFCWWLGAGAATLGWSVVMATAPSSNLASVNTLRVTCYFCRIAREFCC